MGMVESRGGPETAVAVVGDVYELRTDLSGSAFYSGDMAPTTRGA